ncbi:LytR C-terminal domain-containing protein, partial [Angustibacter aerolatus]
TAWALAGHDDQPARTTAVAASVPVQRVVAVALSDDDRLTGVAVLAGTPQGDAQQVMVPSRLLLDVPVAGRIAVAQALVPGPEAPGRAVADALGLRVDATWQLSRSDLVTLVDGVGGVTVDVDVDVTEGARSGSRILVPAGPAQHLTGAQAAAYAVMLGSDEPEAARLARQDHVLTAVLAGLPADRASRLALVTSLSHPPTKAALDAVLTVTGDVHDAARAGRMGSTVLPVHEIDTGGDTEAYGLDEAAAATMVAQRLPGAALPVPPGGRLKVLVQNGVGTPGLGESARGELVEAGYRYVGGGNVDGFGVETSQVLIGDGTSASRRRGLAVATALGLPRTSLRISESAPTVADVVVVLGADFARH